MIADKDWRLGLAMVMAVLTLAVAAPAPASAATSCRFGNEGDIYGAPVVQRLRVTRVPCFAAGLVADNIVEYWNEHKRRLPRHWPANVSRWRCSYRARHTSSGRAVRSLRAELSCT